MWQADLWTRHCERLKGHDGSARFSLEPAAAERYPPNAAAPCWYVIRLGASRVRIAWQETSFMTARFGSRGLKYVLLAATGVAIGLLPPSLRADHPTGALPGHSVNGDTFDEGPRRAATLIPGTGNVHFPISTKNAEA